ncbi:MAG: alpha/beta fold hydrolase [Chthoniobacterales bacterium]
MKTALSALVLPLLIGQTELSAQSPRPPAPIIEQFGVADDGTILTWQVFPARGVGKHPNVLVIHGGGFDSNPPTNDLLNCAKDLSNAGMNAFIISYRLAPPGLIPGQTSDGRYPDQSNDVLLAVHAARIDSRGNGKVGAVGGSAGGSHTVYVAATGIPGDTQIDVGVSLSGAYDYGDKTSWNWQDGSFFGWVSNYVNSTRAQTLYAASPIAFVKAGMPPLFLYASDSEPMPPQQLTDLMAKLDSVKVKNYQAAVIPGRAHAFALWNTVSAEAIAFLLPALQL